MFLVHLTQNISDQKFSDKIISGVYHDSYNTFNRANTSFWFSVSNFFIFFEIRKNNSNVRVLQGLWLIHIY